MTKPSLDAWLQRLESLHPKAMDLGLERVAEVARRLALLPCAVPVVTVAGTNGKGTTAAVIEGLLRQAGHRTGMFTSPHLLRFNERIRVDGADVSDSEITEAFAAIDSARAEVSLTYFEFSALAALYVFRARQPDFIILEVGLGGRLDAVNIVDPTVAVITSIAMDHQEWLGDTRGKIALEKAGILRAGVPVVLGDPDPPPELLARIEELQARPLYRLGAEMTLTQDAQQWQLCLTDAGGASRALPAQKAGPLVPENVAAALQAVLLLGVQVDDASLADVLRAAAPRARRELFDRQGVSFVLDVAHNPAAVGKLLEYTEGLPQSGKRIAVFSAMRDKDLRGMLEPAAAYFDAWFLADQPRNPRAAAAADIALILREAGVTMLSSSKNLKQAIARVQQIVAPGDCVLVFGSFYTVAEVLPIMQRADRLKEAQ